MKKLKKLWLVVFTLAFLSSCQDPSQFEEEIIDAVKYNIAWADYYSEAISEVSSLMILQPELYSAAITLGFDPMEEVDDHMTDFDQTATDLFLDDNTFKEALVIISNTPHPDYPEMAEEILAGYNSLTVRLSDYKLISESGDQKTWSFKDIRTELEFHFTLESGAEQDFWYCEPAEQSLTQYILKGTI